MKKNIYIDFAYLIILAATFGGVIVLGAFVAPIIFHTDKILEGILLDHYNAGIIMGSIFHDFFLYLKRECLYLSLKAEKKGPCFLCIPLYNPPVFRSAI